MFPSQKLLKTIRKPFILALSFTAIALYWKDSIKIYLFRDDWLFFIKYATSDTTGLIKYIFKPEEVHWMPIFKAFYYLEYVLFGLDYQYFHLVLLFLFSISAVLLYKFIETQLNDRVTAGFCAGLYAVNSAYSHVVTWVMLQVMVLCLVFILAALLSASDALKKDRSLFLSGIFCLLSALTWGIGVLSFVVVAVYCVHVLHARGSPNPLKESLRKLAFVLSLLILYIGLFFIFNPGIPEGIAKEGGGLSIALNIAALPGDLLAKTAGVYLRDFASTMDAKSLLMVVKILIFFAYVILTFFLMRRMDRNSRGLTGFGMFLMILFTAVVASGRSWIDEFSDFSEINRYKYFPFFGLILSLAPAISYLKHKHKGGMTAAIVLVFVVLSTVHHKKTAESFYTDLTGQTFVNLVEKRLKEGDSRYLEDYGLLRLGHIQHFQYLKFLHLVKQPEDKITRFKGKLLLLKEFEGLLPAGWVPSEDSNVILNNKTIKVQNKIASLRYNGLQTGPFGHLYIKMKSDTPFEGLLLRYTAAGRAGQTTFKVKKSYFYKEYLLPCPNGVELLLKVGPGNIKIKDIRLYK